MSVILATYQRRESLRRTLTALSSQTAPPESYEVIVSIDGSTDGTREMLAEQPFGHAVRTVEGPNRGRGAANNAAILLARSEVLILLDDDMEASPALVESHRRHHGAGTRRCVLGAVPVKLTDGAPRAARYIAFKFEEHTANIARPGHVFNPYDFYTGNVSLRTEVMREVGLFDESFVAYGHEDVELFVRLRAAQVTVSYDAAALAHQSYEKGLRALAQDRVNAGMTAVKLAQMHPMATQDLALAHFYRTSRRRVVIRAALLALTRRLPRTRDQMFAVGRLLERVGLWRSLAFYDALLDYAYWSGADAALGATTPEGRLASVLADIRRGPIDLLLHR